MKYTIILGIALLAVNTGCMEKEVVNQNELKYTIMDAPEWTALFHRSSGWFGGDGIFAFSLKGNDKAEINDSTQTMFIFSDTMVGEIVDDTLQPGFVMVNNSAAFLKSRKADNDQIEFKVAETAKGKSKAIFVPNTPNSQPEEYYWLGDGFYNNVTDKIYLFAYRIIDIPERPVWKFDEVGGCMISFDPDEDFPFENHKQVDTPFWFSDTTDLGVGSFGAGIYENIKFAGAPDPDGYIYIYGVRGRIKTLYAARVKPANFESFELWEYYSHDSWTRDMDQMTGIVDSVSNELSVTALPNSQYALIFQIGGLVPTVGMRIGDSPVGPFGPTIEIWDCSEAILEKEFVTYNAKAHPALSKPGELLISYNVNSFDFWNQIYDYPNLYRPRFFKIVFE